jgi:FlaA1/EpsC-like NDP-sugar epimerase
VILHAAAHKHVPLMESNVAEAIENNVFATRRLVDLAGAAGVDTFVLISSDKAVRPSSVMGATKRVAELIVQDAQQRHPGTRFLAVRFGNVMGSTGSVIPIFREQIAAGGPVTVTHPEAARYFMTIPEAASLVLQAGAIGKRGEIAILDMGEPIRIVDLAEDMIRLSGRRPRVDVAIEFIGLRPGEKLGEELCVDAGGLEPTTHPKIFAAKSKAVPANRLELALASLAERVRTGEEEAIRSCLTDLLPEASLVSQGAGEEEPDRSSRAMS